MLNVVLAAVLTIASPPLVTAEGVTLQADGKKPWTSPFIGVQLDVGAPDGAGASLVVTPARFLRFSIGGLTNGVGAGGRLGVMLVAFPASIFRPLLGVDVGYVFGGQGAWLPNLIENEAIRNTITGANVAFANGQAGFELGSRHVAFTLRAGLSYIDVGLRAQRFATGGESIVSARGLGINGFIPSARLGFLFLFG